MRIAITTTLELIGLTAFVTSIVVWSDWLMR